MARQTTDDRLVEMRVTGDLWLKEWGRAERFRFPGYPTADVLWVAAHGGGGGSGCTSPLPLRLQPVADALRLMPPPKILLVDRVYVRGWTAVRIHHQLDLTRGTQQNWLREVCCYIAGVMTSQQKLLTA